MPPPKIDFRFLFYTPKTHIFKEKYTFFNAYKVKKKYPKNIIKEKKYLFLMPIY